MPGDLYPRDAPRTTSSTAERALHEALRRQLPKGWTAWHSMRLRVGGSWEGEADFVIADPTRGFVCLEVKGGQLELRDGHWLQNGRALAKPPRDQAHAFVKNLAGEVSKRAGDTAPYGIACAFPDTDFSDGPDTGDLQGLVFGRRQLEWLGELLPTLFDRAIGDRVPRNGKWLAALHAIWGMTWLPRVRLLDRVEDSMQRLVALDDEQLRLLDYAGDVRDAWVHGPAGSGKTIIASALCERRSREGQRVQYFCFTEALAKAVDRGFADARAAGHDVHAHALRSYALGLVGKAGLPSAIDTAQLWEQVTLSAATDALPPADQRPDLVVVDEAQDFAETDWLLVEELSRGRARWCFGDEAQRFWDDRRPPASIMAGAARLRLGKQQRNPEPIAALAARYSGGTGAVPASDAVRVVACEGDELERVRHELDTLRKEGVRAEDIAVLSLAGLSRSQLVKRERMGSHRLVKADDDHAGTQLIADTFLRFKGLERPCIIVCELGGPDVSHFDRRMHIALTRATATVIIVGSGERLRADSRLAGLL